MNEVEENYIPEIDEVIPEGTPALAEVCHDGEELIETTQALPFFMATKTRINYKALGDRVIAEFTAQNHRILTMDDTGEMFMYVDGVYVSKAERAVQRMAQDLMDSYSTEHNKKNVLGYIRTRTRIERLKFNKKGYEINLKNGIYNIITDEFRDATSDDLFTYQFSIKYDANATCPNINRFFDRILPDKDIRTVQEEIAYVFVPDYPIQMMAWWIGGGGNGKGTLYRLMEIMFDKDNMTFSSMHDLAHNTDYCRAELYGKVVNVCGDISLRDLKNTDNIKKLTGGDTLIVRHIRQEPFKMTNRAKLFFSMNDVPAIIDDSEGFWRRVLPTQFNETLTEEEKKSYDECTLHSEEEISGFFNCLMMHIKNVIKNKCFTDAPTMDDIKDSMVETESIGRFFDAHVEHIDSNESVRYEKSELYDDYVQCAKDFNMVPQLRIPFFKHLKNILYMDAKQRIDPADGKKKRYYIGYRNRTKLLLAKLAKNADGQ